MRLEKEVETRGMDVPEAFQETSVNETVADVSQLQLDNSFYHRLASVNVSDNISSHF